MTSTRDYVSSDEQRIRKKCFNSNLLALKCLLFLFFGGMGCLFPFLPLHMREVGLTKDSIGMISMVSALVAVIGPIIAGPVADRMATHNRRQANDKSNPSGRHLRLMIAVTCVFSALFYALLLLVPVTRIEYSHERSPNLNFSCDPDGAFIYQERCRDRDFCYRWTEQVPGKIILTECQYICDYVDMSKQQLSRRKSLFNSYSTTTSQDFLYDDTSSISTVAPLRLPQVIMQIQSLVSTATRIKIIKTEVRRRLLQFSQEQLLASGTSSSMLETFDANKSPPKVCFEDHHQKEKYCHIFNNEILGRIVVNVTLGQAINSVPLQPTEDEWCAHPIADYLVSCQIPSLLKSQNINKTCFVQCKLEDPYTVPGNRLEESLCGLVKIGNPKLTFWMYLVIRSVADVFPTAAVALLDAAVVIATRETSCGRGDVGCQLSFGSLGLALFGPLTGYMTSIVPKTPIYVPIALHCLLMLLAACLALSANGMPLSPPEWWWQTQSGMLAIPMSTVKRYGSETAALVLILIIMGIFWSAMDSYLPLYLAHLGGDELSIGIVLTIGALPTVFFLYKSEHLVDYCGHSNLLILAFTIYIVRYVGLSVVLDTWWALISEALEFFTLGIMWVTAVLYMRHLVPRHMTVTAQTLPVIAHFCIGRALGAVIGAYVDVDDDNYVESLKSIYRYMAVAAALVAAVYFILYHGVLKPRCHAQNVQSSRNQPSTIQAINENGSYTPLRIYHNDMAKKGEFRY